MSNLSVLQRNIIHALDCEVSEMFFLKALEKVDTLTAERHAYVHHMLVNRLSPMLDMAARVQGLDAVPQGLMAYILDRHWFTLFPNQ